MNSNEIFCLQKVFKNKINSGNYFMLNYQQLESCVNKDTDFKKYNGDYIKFISEKYCNSTKECDYCNQKIWDQRHPHWCLLFKNLMISIPFQENFDFDKVFKKITLRIGSDFFYLNTFGFICSRNQEIKIKNNRIIIPLPFTDSIHYRTMGAYYHYWKIEVETYHPLDFIVYSENVYTNENKVDLKHQLYSESQEIIFKKNKKYRVSFNNLNIIGISSKSKLNKDLINGISFKDTIGDYILINEISLEKITDNYILFDNTFYNETIISFKESVSVYFLFVNTLQSGPNLKRTYTPCWNEIKINNIN